MGGFGTGCDVRGRKGFNQEVEDVYKAKGSLNYDDVDRTEAQDVSEEELYKFIVDGHLSLGE
jgi:hypothetical protein